VQPKLAPSSLARPPAPSQLATLDPQRDPAERQADTIGAQIGRDWGGTIAPSSGKLPGDLRAVAEQHLGVDLGETELRTDTQAQRHADGMTALAVTEGSQIHFARGMLAASSQEGRALLGHELTHVAQQRAHGVESHQRIVATTEQIGLPSSEERARGDAAMDKYLATQAEHEKEYAGKVAGIDAEEIEKRRRRELLTELERVVRLRAIGIMAAHRGQIKAARDKVINESKTSSEEPGKKAPAGPAKPSRALNETRQAAKMLVDLQGEEERLSNSKRELDAANRSARGLGDVGDVVDVVTAPENVRYVSASLMREIGEGYIASTRMGKEKVWAIGATFALKDLRKKQVFGVQQAMSRLHEAFPVLSVLNLELVNPKREKEAVTDPLSGFVMQPSQTIGEAGDDELRMEIERGYAAILAKIDDAIGAIAKGDVSVYDLPVAMETAAVAMKPEAAAVLQEEKAARKHEEFWIRMGLTILEATMVLIPVVGPLVAGAAASLSLAVALSDFNQLIDQRKVAEASTNPFSSPLGVERVSNFDVAMVAIGAIMTALDAGVVFQAVRTGRISSEFASMIDRVDELRKARRSQEADALLSSAGREQRLARSAEMESLALTDRQAQTELLDVLDSGLATGKPGQRKAPVGKHEWREDGFGKWCRFSDGKKCITIPDADIPADLLIKRRQMLESLAEFIENDPGFASMRRFDPDARVGIQGSVVRGRVGNPDIKPGQIRKRTGLPFAPDDIDVDIFIISTKIPLHPEGKVWKVFQQMRDRLVRSYPAVFDGLREGGAGFSIKVIRPHQTAKELKGPNVMF
jgi:hypothetical protein